ncbi:acyltransferase domain-containing protein [Paenibacillus kobensis]|uniref:acyltransferase domain-containing protein n=1 Tax=Paenibacillus kobensis TaxID=59841 RepID=UPI000FD9C913|nr:acyltransferase domain-containing protein [Paenibacillus kobensis]
MSERPVVFMFSGQGSQYVGMGRELYDYEANFRKWMDRLDQTFRELTGHSVVERLYPYRESGRKPFEELLFTHAAIFMVEYSLAQTLAERGMIPDYVLGYSMGEFAAGAVAGVMTADDGIRCLVKQAELLQERCVPGGMIAVVGDPGIFESSPPLRQHAELAAVNFRSHFVLSARRESLPVLEQHLLDKGAAFQRLPIPFAFHSSWIDPAAEAFRDFMSTIRVEQPRIPYLSSRRSPRAGMRGAADYWDAVREAVDFPEGLARLEEGRHYTYIDLGPSGTLANFVKYNVSSHRQGDIVAIMTPFGNEMDRIDALCDRIS